jgi:hypothetical protein
MFAYPEKRLYPINSKEELYKSAEQFVAGCDTIPEHALQDIADRMIKAATFYGIEPPKLEKKAPKSTEEVYETRTGAFSMTVPKTLDDCRVASEFILSKRASTQISELRKAALRIVKTVNELDGDIWEEPFRKMARIAGIGVGDRKEILEEFEKRGVTRQLVPAEAEAFWKYAADIASLSDSEFYSMDTMQKIADCMDEIDHLQNNMHEYGKRLQAPEDVVYKYSTDDLRKEAADMLEIPAAGIVLSKKATLERKDAINKWFNKFYGHDPVYGDALFGKIATMKSIEAEALLDAIDDSED